MKSNQKSISYDIAIIGAGAAGLMAAITSARKGKKVLILEHKDKAGKKLLATGNGRCNFTNDHMVEDCFNGNESLLHEILCQFSKDETLDFFREIGLIPKSKNGYYYPNSMQASSVVDALVLECSRIGVDIVCLCKIDDIYEDKYGFVIESNNTYKTQRLIIATGLLANPRLGSDGSIFDIIKGFGHGFTKLYPALCGFNANGLPFKSISGVRTDVEITLLIDEEPVSKDLGELQLTDYGVSGIPVFQISSKAVRAIHKKKSVELIMDFLPDIEEEKFTTLLVARKNALTDQRNVIDFLNGILNSKLIIGLLNNTKINIKMPAVNLSEKDIITIVKAIKSSKIRLESERSYDFAQVCSGGIRTEDINISTLESKLIPGLFFAGEILDVDGICGGYNLQWAWSSGYVAGTNAAN